MARFTEKDFPEIALAAFFVQASRNPGVPTIELARQGAEIAEQIIREENLYKFEQGRSGGGLPDRPAR